MHVRKLQLIYSCSLVVLEAPLSKLRGLRSLLDSRGWKPTWLSSAGSGESCPAHHELLLSARIDEDLCLSRSEQERLPGKNHWTAVFISQKT